MYRNDGFLRSTVCVCVRLRHSRIFRRCFIDILGSARKKFHQLRMEEKIYVSWLIVSSSCARRVSERVSFSRISPVYSIVVWFFPEYFAQDPSSSTYNHRHNINIKRRYLDENHLPTTFCWVPVVHVDFHFTAQKRVSLSSEHARHR